MGFFRQPLTPRWARQLPDYMRLTTAQVDRLEDIRKRVGASHDEFLIHIAGHPEMTRRVLHYQGRGKKRPREACY